MALEVYQRMMSRDLDRDAGARLDALVRGADWAPMGTNGEMDDALAELHAEAATRNSLIGSRVALMGGDGLEPPTPSV